MSSPPDYHRKQWLFANTLATAGLIFFSLYHLTAFRFVTLFTVEARMVDFTLWRFVPSYIWNHARYPAVVTGDWVHSVFPYLPSGAAMLLPLSIPPEPVAFAIWLLIEAGAFALAIWASLRLSGAMEVCGPMVIAITAVLLSDSAISWDFRIHNTNIVYLALLMLGLASRRTWLSAMLNESDRSYTIQIEASSYPNWSGSKQTRTVASVTADELKINNPASSTGGAATQLTYKRAK